MQQYIDDHIEAVVTRYAYAVDRWDVINEPLETLGSRVDQNIITTTLGQTWMVRAFQQARSLDPSAKLYLNEALAERPGAKHEGLLTLVGALLDAGAPIDEA
jgi:endo-1,4-beta-xylanase